MWSWMNGLMNLSDHSLVELTNHYYPVIQRSEGGDITYESLLLRQFVKLKISLFESLASNLLFSSTVLEQVVVTIFGVGTHETILSSCCIPLI